MLHKISINCYNFFFKGNTSKYYLFFFQINSEEERIALIKNNTRSHLYKDERAAGDKSFFHTVFVSDFPTRSVMTQFPPSKELPCNDGDMWGRSISKLDSWETGWVTGAGHCLLLSYMKQHISHKLSIWLSPCPLQKNVSSKGWNKLQDEKELLIFLWSLDILITSRRPSELNNS